MPDSFAHNMLTCTTCSTASNLANARDACIKMNKDAKAVLAQLKER